MRSKIGTKLTLGFGALILLLAGNGVVLSTYPGSAIVWVSFVFYMTIAAAGLLVVRRIVKNVGHVVARMESATAEAASAAEQLALTSQDMAMNAAIQSEEIEQDSGGSVEIASIARQAAENSRSAAGMVQDAHTVAMEVTTGLEEMMGAMQEIEESSHRISRITKVVDEIAFQTNLLALNAAVEAARAGAAGQGFAVVADEVRNLAQRAAEAGREITTLVQESSAHAKTGNEKLDRVVANLSDFLEKESQTKDLIEEVAESIELQAGEMERLSISLAKIEEITRRTAAGANQTAATGEQMSTQAGSLTELVSALRGAIGAG